MVRQAIIMAAGKGSRMKSDSSKPMTKVGNKKLIQYGIDALLANGIDMIYIIYSKYSEDVLQLKEIYPNISFVKQDYVNGSLSSFKFIETICKPPFLLLDCDIIFSRMDFAKMLKNIEIEDDVYAYFTIVLNPTQNNPKYIKFKENRITDFNKKGFLDGYSGGMIYLWNNFPKKEVEEFYKNSNSLAAFYSQLVKQYHIKPMVIKRLLDVDTLEEINQVENDLKDMLE